MERKINSTTPVSFFLTSVLDPNIGMIGASPAVELKKAGAGVFAAAVGAVTESGYGWYEFTPAGADFDTVGDLLFHVTAVGANPADFKIDIVDNIEQDTFIIASDVQTVLNATYAIVQGLGSSSMLADVLRMTLFQYTGNVNNVFSRVDGAFVGSIDFHVISMSNFLIDAAHPPSVANVLSNRLCTLNSDGTMTNLNLGISGEILFFAFDAVFEALSDVVINLYNDTTKANTQVYVPKGVRYAQLNKPYYPTVDGTLLSQQIDPTRVVPLTDAWICKQVALISQINWDNIAVPVVVSQPSIGGVTPLKMTIIRDRTQDMTFTLDRNITGDTIYFAMKTDKKQEFYDVAPIPLTITDAIHGTCTLTIPNTATQNLPISRYYGELVRRTASNKYQTLVPFEIYLVHEIISTRDI